jgi:iron complex outermembrane receptor protein
MILRKIFSAILYLFVIGSALSEETSDLVTDIITVKDSFIDSRIIKFPATVETYDKKQIEESINAATPAQTLKYLPSIQVRERSIGDPNGIIASRTIGAISSAQSMLYMDGILLSNLLGNSYSYPPRWGMVSPEEIQNISMMYGPFSSIYAGNSLGGVINIQTRMPDKFESHATVHGFHQNFKLYGTDQTSIGNHQTASFGNKINDLSFWFDINRLENRGQPLDFSVLNRSTTSAGAQTLITGAYEDISEKNANRVVFGATNITDSTQTNIKFKATYDLANQTKLNYTLGIWDLDSKTDVQSYIKDLNGNSIYYGDVNFNNKKYTVGAMNPAKGEALHIMQALDLKSDTKGFNDWQFTLSNYNYSKDLSNSSDLATAGQVNPYKQTTVGKLTDQNGTGWTIFDARATLRPKDHSIDIGYHIDGYQLRSTINSTDDWTVNQKGGLLTASNGNTQTQALYIQDKWQISPLWSLTLGGRQEYWEAFEGSNYNNTSNPNLTNYSDKSDAKFSPKVSLNYEPIPAWGFRAAFGKAYRFPTVTELYQQLITSANLAIQNNPNLRPEEIFSGELTAERRFLNGLVRVSFFNEHKYDALLSQTTTVNTHTNCPSASTGATQCTYIQNVDHIRTYGAELSTQWQNVFISGLDLNANATFTDGKVLQDTLTPANAGKNAPRLPKQLYKAVATYHIDNNLTLSLAGRYSGRQYINLDNSDTNPETYKAASQFLFVDAKANYKFKDRWTASLGIDNIFNDQAYVSHPYPQRTGYAQIKFDY